MRTGECSCSHVSTGGMDTGPLLLLAALRAPSPRPVSGVSVVVATYLQCATAPTHESCVRRCHMRRDVGIIALRSFCDRNADSIAMFGILRTENMENYLRDDWSEA